MDRATMTLGPGMDMPIMHDSDRYDLVREIGSGNFGVARLMRDKQTKELVAVKYFERGDKILAYEVLQGSFLLSTTYIWSELLSFNGIIMSILEQICHRDLKLENTLLDGSPAPRLKICDFGYSKSSLLHSQPKSTVGTPAYIAPEVLHRKEYDGKIADVWSCGVTLYVMLVGSYPFEDPENPKDFRKTIQRVLNVQYSIPEHVVISEECQHLISRIFVADPEQRITIPEIKNHVWFLKNLPAELMDERTLSNQFEESDPPLQSPEVIMQIISEATIPPAGLYNLDMMDDDMDDMYSDPDDLDVDSSGEFIYAM
ncbi:hypothetical protein DH2020_012352 [Rehmannia glutinosa]|uniref:non-specific serine/threonine protein kinase n=1 Tax=Rehmannia glutinosa TaxID=99300 RepID=A0ABR0WZ37_REHGL